MANNRYLTREELMEMRVYALPNFLYRQIMAELERTFRRLSDRMVDIFNNATIYELDQYVDIYKYIRVLW